MSYRRYRTGAIVRALSYERCPLFVQMFTLTQNRLRVDEVLGVWPLHGLRGVRGGIACSIFGQRALAGPGGVSFGALDCRDQRIGVPLLHTWPPRALRSHIRLTRAPNRRAMMDMEFEGQLALVTGASKGIGLACARRLASAGARVIGVARGRPALDAAVAALAADGLTMDVEVADVSDGAAALALVERFEATIGPIDLLVNSAGAARRFTLDELDAAALRQGMDAKYFSTVHVLEPVIRRMGERGRGRIVNIIGQGGRRAAATHIPGGAANAALMLATVGFASAYAGRGVRVNGINPGLTRTGRVDQGLEAAARASGRAKGDLLAESIASIPMGRMAEPEEIAEVAAFLLSTRASYVTGAIIPMDGGAAAVP